MVFKVNTKKTSGKDLFRAVIRCQANDDKEIVLIDTKGLRVDPVPEVEEHELDWSPSGLSDPNSWRDRRSVLDWLLRR